MATQAKIDNTGHFGRWLERTIQEKGNSVYAFAAIAGVNPRTMYRLTRSDAPRMYGHTIVRVARALGIERDEIEMKLAEAEGAHPETASAA